MIDPAGYDTQTFLPAIERLIEGHGSELRTTSAQLLHQIPQTQINAFLSTELAHKRPTIGDYLPELAAAMREPLSAIGLAAGKHLFKQVRHARLRTKTTHLLYNLNIARAQTSLDDTDKALIRNMANLYVNSAITNETWHAFANRMTYGDGTQCTILPPDKDIHNPNFPATYKLLEELLQYVLPDYTAFRTHTAATIARFNSPSFSFTTGTRWMTANDPPSLAGLSFTPAPNALLIGDDAESKRPVVFTGNESLITIGPPGSGKTECQVIPNLLTYPGSVIVLDVKGELWARTAGARTRFGQVIRFAPTDDTGATYRYNPLDFIGRDPEEASRACTALAAQIIPSNSEAREPFWTDRGRDYVRAMTLLVAMTATPDKRHFGNVLRCLSLPTGLKSTAANFKGSFSEAVINAIRDVATQHNIAALKDVPNELTSGMGGTTLPSILEHSRQALSIFNSSETVRNAIATSDWHPSILRTHPGTSVYLCLSGDELDAYAPLMRIILAQHASVLLTNFTNVNTGLPVTFFLDEFPQLGPSTAIRRMLETGRGAGLRLWLFAQTLGQIEAAYGQKVGESLPNMCGIQCFMRCDATSAAYLQPYLGKTTDILTGKETHLAPLHELTVGKYADKIIAITRNPYLLEKRYAYKTMAHMQMRPPTGRPTPRQNPTTRHKQ